MLRDTYNRKIDYLRVSITDRCNLRCVYCMPQEGIVQKPQSEILSFEEIVRIIKLCATLGINKVKISGGEPLVRQGFLELLQAIIGLPGLKDVSLTTNGILLKKYIKGLKICGLKRMNISLDTLEAPKFRQITRAGELKDVLEGIDAAISEGFLVKLNVVIMKGVNADEALNFAEFAQEKKIILRFIELMPMVDSRRKAEDLYISCLDVQDKLRILGKLNPIQDESFGNGPAEYFKIEEAPLVVGFISPMSCKFCLRCNRLRLTSSGMLMPCLASDAGFDLKAPLREGKVAEALALINKVIQRKPLEHDFNLSLPRLYQMSEIGG